MKTLDSSPEGIFDISWSPDGKWLAYVRDSEVRMVEVASGEVRIIGPGLHPGITAEQTVVLERDDQIYEVSASGERILIDQAALVPNSPKRHPVVSPDGRQVLFVVCNVFDKDSQSKNAYPYRHFWGITALGGAKPKMLAEQHYGGIAGWFPSSEQFYHFEFDSTGGAQVHIVGIDGVKQGLLAGLYPSIAPDALSLAVRPRGGGNVVVYTTKGGWSDEEVSTKVHRLPAEGVTRPDANPPVWLDNRMLLVVEGDALWRVDVKREKTEPFKKLPLPANRRTRTVVASPDLENIAMEVATEEGFDLRVASLR